MKVELWTHTPHGYLQRVYGSVDKALAAARAALESGNTIQVRLSPERPLEPWSNADEAP